MAVWGALNNTNNAGSGLLNGLAVFGGGAGLPAGSWVLQSVSVYIQSASGGGNWRMAVYQGGASSSDPTGATKVWDSGLRTDNFASVGWQTIAASGALSGATRTWLVMKSELTQNYYVVNSTDAGDLDASYEYYTSSGGMNPNDATIAFPSTISAAPDGSTGPGLKFYLTYVAAGGGTLTADAGSYALTGQDAQFSENLGGRDTGGLVVGSGASWIGASYVGAKDASAGGGGSPYTMAAAQGSYSLNGQAVTLRAARRLVAAQGAYSLTGQAVALRLGKNMAAAQGSYALTGQAAAFRRGRTLVAEQGSYSLIGSEGLVDIVMAAGAGSYALNGQDVGLSYSGGGARSMPAGQGSYTLTGQTAALRVARRLVADAGSYALTGFAAGLKAGRSLAAALGTYSLSGQAVTLTYSGAGPKTLAAAQGLYLLTGQDIGLTYSGAPATPSGGDWQVRARRRAVR